MRELNNQLSQDYTCTRIWIKSFKKTLIENWCLSRIFSDSDFSHETSPMQQQVLSIRLIFQPACLAPILPQLENRSSGNLSSERSTFFGKCQTSDFLGTSLGTFSKNLRPSKQTNDAFLLFARNDQRTMSWKVEGLDPSPSNIFILMKSPLKSNF